MIKRLIIPVLLIFMALSPPVFADPELIRLAEQGDAECSVQSSLDVRPGEGVPQDYKAAVKWYTLAAEQGYADAQYNLAWMYANGEGVPQDYKAAVKWYTLAAEQGLAQAQSI